MFPHALIACVELAFCDGFVDLYDRVIVFVVLYIVDLD